MIRPPPPIIPRRGDQNNSATSAASLTTTNWESLTRLQPAVEAPTETTEFPDYQNFEAELENRLHQLTMDDGADQLELESEYVEDDLGEGYDYYPEYQDSGLRIHASEDGVYFYGAPGAYAAEGQFGLLPAVQEKPAMSWAAVVGTASEESSDAQTAPAPVSNVYASSAVGIEPQPSSLPMCKFFLRGFCRFGEYCRFSHDAAPTAAEDEQAAIAREVEDSRSLECNICYENIVQRGQRFGLLANCNHTFCLDCIRNWRGSVEQSKESVRMCPVCRQESFFIVPSYRMIYDAERKAKIIEEFKQNTARIPCKYFDQGRKTCPFGSSCFFAHLLPDGTRAQYHFRAAVNSEGKYDLVPQTRLSQFLPDSPR